MFPSFLQKHSIHLLQFIILLACLAFACFNPTFQGTPLFPVDDAYIALHNARVILTGNDVNFPGVSPLTGSTSSVYLALLVVLGKVLPLEWASYALGWVAFFLYLYLVAAIAQKKGLGFLPTLLLVVSAATFGKTLLQMMNGLETGLAMATITALIYLLEFNSIRARTAGALIAGVLPAIRPECFPLSLIMLYLFSRGAWGDQRRVLHIGLLAGAFVIGMAPWLIWSWIELGSAIPNTISAKTAYFAESCQPAAIRFYVLAKAMGYFFYQFGPFLLFAFLLLLSKRGTLFFAFIIIFFFAYFQYFPSALHQYYSRYFYPLVPLLLFAALQCLASHRKTIKVAAYALLVISLSFNLYRINANYGFYERSVKFTANELARLADWLNQHIEPDKKILVHDAGYVSWATPFKLVDLVGLKTPSSVYWNESLTLKSCGDDRGKAVAEIARSNDVHYAIVLTDWDNFFGNMPGLEENGWTVELLRDGGRKGYNVYQLEHRTSLPFFKH